MSFEVTEMSTIDPNIIPIPEFVHVLHHCVSEAIRQDPSFASVHNTVDISKPNVPQTLQFFSLKGVKAAVGIIFNFMQVGFALSIAKAKLSDTLVQLIRDVSGT
jgi:hypothetical protein